MSHNNLINDKKNALLAYKEKILNEIKYCEKSIDDLRANIKHKNVYDDHGDSSDSEDDFPSAIDIGPSVTQLKLQQAMIKTCLLATQELTGLTILQSAVDVLVEDPKFEGESPVTEPGTWREVIAECRLDLIPFTMTFFMHTPDRKFAPTSYRGLSVVPVKPPQELELSKSVLNSLKTPSDAVEVMRSYAAGYRSRRTTLARLDSKYRKNFTMEPHPEGGYVMKCADLLEVCWRLENKWSPVAPFHHRMKFNLEFMEESYVKSIAQAHKQLLDPTIGTDERTLLLADIITTCLEARGTVDPDSDLESKTTERDNDVDMRDSENEKRDSEVMAPPKSLPKKGKQKNIEQNTAQKRSLDDKGGETRAKKIKNDDPEAKKNSIETNNSRKSKINDVPTEGGKKRKINEVNKVNAKNVKESGNIEDADVNSKDNNKVDKATNIKAKNTKQTENNAKSNNIKEKEDKLANANSKPKNIKESVSNDDKNTNDKTKNKIAKESDNSEAKGINAKPKTKKLKEPTNILKEPATIDNNPKPKTKTDKKLEMNDNMELKEKQSKNSDKTKSTVKQTSKELSAENAKNVVNKAKNVATKETGTLEQGDQNKNNVKTKHIEKKKSKTVANTKSKQNIDSNKDAARTKNKVSEKTSNTEITIDPDTNNIDNKTKNTDTAKAKSVPNTKNYNLASKKAPESNTNVANTKNDKVTKKVTEKKTKDKVTEVANKDTEKNIKENTSKINVKNVTQTIKKVIEKNATSIKNKHKISPITNKVPETNDKEKPALIKQIPEKVLDNIKKTKDLAKSITKNITKKPIITKIASHRNSLKPQNPPKLLKAGNTKSIGTGNTGKENGGKGTKIPQKKLSINSEGSSKKNMLRVSPRKIPSKFKPTSQETYKQKMMKSTNIPRLLKKPSPKTT